MLPDRYCQLLTAYVDGQLGKRHQKMVLRLLRKSPEARLILKQLQENAEKLKNMPPQTLGSDFPQVVLHKIDELQPPTVSFQAGRSSRPFPSWLAGAVAASVLALVTGVSYWFFSPSHKETSNLGTVAENNPQVTKKQKNVPPPQVAKKVEEPALKLSGSGIQLAVVDLAKEKTHTTLTKALKNENAVHLEFTVKSHAKAITNLNQVLKNNGVKVLVDAKVNPKIKPNPKTEILVYAENLQPEELANILQKIGASEQTQNAGQRQFNSIQVKTLTPDHRQQLARLFGIDAQQLQPPPRGDLGTFIQAPNAKNKKKPGAKTAHPLHPPEKIALVLATEPGQNPTSSPELQRFLQNRQQNGLQPGTLQVIVVIRLEVA